MPSANRLNELKDRRGRLSPTLVWKRNKRRGKIIELSIFIELVGLQATIPFRVEINFYHQNNDILLRKFLFTPECRYSRARYRNIKSHWHYTALNTISRAQSNLERLTNRVVFIIQTQTLELNTYYYQSRLIISVRCVNYGHFFFQ